MSDEEILVTIKMPAPFNDFILEVGANDTIRQLKVKIQEAVGGDPIGPMQIRDEFIDLVLPDFMTLFELSISATLSVMVEFQPPEMSPETPPAPPQSEGNRMITVVLKYGETTIPVKVRAAHKVSKLKEKISIKEGIPVSRISVKNSNGVDLPDDKTLQDCKISSDSRITMEFLPESSQPAEAAPLQSPRRDEICVVLQYKERMVTVNVTAAHTVMQLRTQLQDAGMNMNLQLPENYFFMRKNAVMGEETSFGSQNVARGHVIQIFEERVERGGGS